ncbi:MAG: HD domain-containing protein [Candidatus Krumholzibacteria bacterium]|nr:HD domain-containing protein [Candidatus Krumholzibacteria bacterium]
MPKTRFERIETGSAEIAAFRVSGKLGFHENEKIDHLVKECVQREFGHVIFDFTELSSLGGGVAKILRSFVVSQNEQGRQVRFVITNDIVLDFLRDDEIDIQVYKSYEEAAGTPLNVVPGEDADDDDIPVAPIVNEDDADLLAKTEEVLEALSVEEKNADEDSPAVVSDVILMSYDGNFEDDEEKVDGDRDLDKRSEEDSEVPEEKDPSADEADSTVETAAQEARVGGKGIISEIFNGTQGDKAAGSSSDAGMKNVEPAKEKDKVDINIKLKRRLLELKTLLSISADFNAIRDKKNLLDIFLLTSIAQGGVESAVFFERIEDSYVPTLMKGVSEKDIRSFSIPVDIERKIAGIHDVTSVDAGSFDEETLDMLKSTSIEYFCPFRISEGVAGLIFLGRRISGRGMKKEDFEFMKILINVAAGAYQNALMLEREHGRTLGIVKTLISLIEENTMLTGTSEFVSRYVGMVAKNMNYPEEHFKDLVYGTVLRDMGMIKVSDLIVRSPRELTREEWNIINKHPEDGSEMLRRMKFDDHVVNIVLSHHERFNGEGYPRGLRGKEIPLGARIISVVESYSAMINERPNRPALSSKEALDTLRENYGLRYDREVVRQFAKIIEKEMARSVRPGVTVS